MISVIALCIMGEKYVLPEQHLIVKDVVWQIFVKKTEFKEYFRLNFSIDDTSEPCNIDKTIDRRRVVDFIASFILNR